MKLFLFLMLNKFWSCLCSLTPVCLQEMEHRRTSLLPENPSEETWVPACHQKTPKLRPRPVPWRGGCRLCSARRNQLRPPEGIPTWPSMSWTWRIRPPATSPSQSAPSARPHSPRPLTPLFPVRYFVRWRPPDRARFLQKGKRVFLLSLSAECSLWVQSLSEKLYGARFPPQ